MRVPSTGRRSAGDQGALQQPKTHSSRRALLTLATAWPDRSIDGERGLFGVVFSSGARGAAFALVVVFLLPGRWGKKERTARQSERATEEGGLAIKDRLLDERVKALLPPGLSSTAAEISGCAVGGCR